MLFESIATIIFLVAHLLSLIPHVTHYSCSPLSCFTPPHHIPPHSHEFQPSPPITLTFPTHTHPHLPSPFTHLSHPSPTVPTLPTLTPHKFRAALLPILKKEAVKRHMNCMHSFSSCTSSEAHTGQSPPHQPAANRTSVCWYS